ncbi:MAG TPA: hypothetical protein VFT22_06905 [Kofleriaceae bacterium]|nr:hypothetical protein [Kofleriaceae bacterium]
MTATARLAALAALAALGAAAPAALADPVLDSCVVRRIQQTDQRLRISVDLDRKDVEAYLRTAATTALADYPGVTIDRITISPGGPRAIGLDVDLTAKLGDGPFSVSCSGTLTGRLAISVADASVVRGEVLLDTIEVSCIRLTVNAGGRLIAGSDRRVAIPGASGALERIAIDSVDASWIAVSLDVRTPAPAPPP